VLASTSDDGTVRLWDAASGAAAAVLRGHEGGIDSCAWSSDGRVLASASDDGTVRLWDVTSGRCIRIHAMWSDEGSPPGHAVWSPEEDRLIAASEDAWRHLGWQGLDDTGVLTRWPLEICGSIDEMTTREPIA
jgi:WD40 repeat protein